MRVFMGWEFSDGGLTAAGLMRGGGGVGHRGKQRAADLRPAHLTLRSTASKSGARRQF